MPLRKTEGAMDDSLKQTSKSIDKITAISKMLENKTGTTEDSKIEWSNLIFLPFQPVFQLFVLLSVIVKVLLVRIIC